MGEFPRVDRVHLTLAARSRSVPGLVGWVRARYGGLVVDGLALRRTRVGHLTLSFPRRRDRSGREHSIVRPLDDAARREIERQVFRALGLEVPE